MSVYGLTIPAGPFRVKRDCIGEVSRTGTGNVAVRVGIELGDDGTPPAGWSQTAYVVMTADEARALALELADQAGAA